MGLYCITVRCDAYTDWTVKDVFWKFLNPLGSELDFKVAWFDLSMINDSLGFWGVLFDSLVFYCMYCTIWCPEGDEGKIQWLLNCCELKENIIIIIMIMIILFIYLFSLHKVGMALILLYLLLLCIGTKCTLFDLQKLQMLIMMLIIGECTSKQDWKKIYMKSSANPFYFSLIWETIFCMNINTMADILACTKKCEAIWREKKNVPFLLYLYISKYLLKYVILLILLTIKGFLNKNLFTCFWTLSRLLELDLLLSVTRLKDLCNH